MTKIKTTSIPGRPSLTLIESGTAFADFLDEGGFPPGAMGLKHDVWETLRRLGLSPRLVEVRDAHGGLDYDIHAGPWRLTTCAIHLPSGGAYMGYQIRREGASWYGEIGSVEALERFLASYSRGVGGAHDQPAAP